jgi:hypothetical protein
MGESVVYSSDIIKWLTSFSVMRRCGLRRSPILCMLS